MVCQEGYGQHQPKARTELGYQNHWATKTDMLRQGTAASVVRVLLAPQHMPIQGLEIAPAWHRGAGVEGTLSIRFCFSDKAKLSPLPWDVGTAIGSQRDP